MYVKKVEVQYIMRNRKIIENKKKIKTILIKSKKNYNYFVYIDG